MANQNGNNAIVELFDGWRSKRNGAFWKRSLLLYATQGAPQEMEPALDQALKRAKATLENAKSDFWWRGMVVGRILIKEGDATEQHPLRVFPTLTRTQSRFLYRLYLGPEKGQWRIASYSVRYGEGKVLESLQPLAGKQQAGQVQS